MPALDSELVSVLRQAKAKPVNFAFVAKGASDGKLLAAKMPIPAKQVNQAKADLGGGLVFKGRCFGEDGQLVFEVPKEPPGTLAGQIKKVIARDTGLTQRVEVRVNQALEEETTAPAAPPAPAPVTPAAPTYEGLMQRVKARTGDYRKANGLASNRKGPDYARLQKLWNDYQQAIYQNNNDLAAKLLDEYERQVDRVLAGLPTEPAAPAAAPAAASSPTPGKLAVLRRLKALAEPYQAAVAAQGPDVARTQALFGAVKGLVDNKDIDQATKVLDELESLVARAQPAPPEAPPAAAPSPTPGKLAVLRRLKALAEPYQAAVAAQGPDVARMQALFGAVKGLVDNRDIDQATKVLDELEPLVARAQAAPPRGPAGRGWRRAVHGPAQDPAAPGPAGPGRELTG